MTENKAKKFIFFGLATIFSFFARLLPHTPNFTPMGALAITAGTYLPKKYALFLPLVAMFASDYFIGFYNVKIMASVYLSFYLYGVLGKFLGKEGQIGRLAGTAVLGALLFFLLTNFAVWAFGSMYSKDFSGLLMSYTLALPFFKNTLLGDLFYTTTFFVAYEFLLKKVLSRKPALSPSLTFAKI